MMSIRDIGLAVLIAAIWGVNFVAIHYSLREISPQLLCLTRFIGASLPAIFLVDKPNAPWRWIIIYGLVMFALQFILIFSGMHVGVSPSLSSILIQTQVFFTIFLAFICLNEKPNRWQIIGALISFSGILLVAKHVDGHFTLLGVFLIISAAFTWSIGNLISKHLGPIHVLSLVSWGSFVAWVPFFVFILYTESSKQVLNQLHHLSFSTISAVLYITYISTLIGYGGWNFLIKKYDAASVAPFTLLVPIFAFSSSSLLLHETFEPWKKTAAMLVMLGLVINLVMPKMTAAKPLQET